MKFKLKPPINNPKFLIMSVLAVTLFLFVIIKTTNQTFSQGKNPTMQKEPDKVELLEEAKSRYNCPVDISKLEIPSNLEKDFTTATQKDFEDYFNNFRTTLENMMYEDLAVIYTEKFQTEITPEMISDVVKNSGTIDLPGDTVTVKEQMAVASEINSCFNQDLEIALAVETAVKMSESQAFITNYLVNMLTEWQEKLNTHRTDVLEKEVKSTIDASNSSPVKLSS